MKIQRKDNSEKKSCDMLINKLTTQMKTSSQSRKLSKESKIKKNKKLILKSKIRKVWKYIEEQKLIQFIATNPNCDWNKCSSFVGTRSAKQCKEKWRSSINPQFKRGFWFREEQLIIFEELIKGNISWVGISSKMAHRSNSAVRNYFFNSIEKLKSSTFVLFLLNIKNLKGILF
jgi:Myb-like DNA-binding protein FlbD